MLISFHAQGHGETLRHRLSQTGKDTNTTTGSQTYTHTPSVCLCLSTILAFISPHPHLHSHTDMHSNYLCLTRPQTLSGSYVPLTLTVYVLSKHDVCNDLENINKTKTQ